MKVERPRVACIKDPIPVAVDIIEQEPGENSLCTPTRDLCVDMVKLTRYLSEAQRWMQSAVDRCKVAP